jgi:glycogen debranching enzyme
MTLTILEGSTFCICDENGDVEGATAGLFASDTRFLSLLRLTVNGVKPLRLSADKVDYFSAAFYLRNPPVGLAPDTLSIARERFVGEGMQDRLAFQNQSMERIAFDVGLEIGTDFADIFAVKDWDFSFGDPQHARPLPERVVPSFDEDGNQFVLSDDGGVPARTQVILSQRGRVDGSTVTYHVELEPRERWDLRIDVVPSLDSEQVVPRAAERRFGDELARVRESLAAWHLRVPTLRADWDALQHAWRQSVADLAALRMRGRNGRGIGNLPAAGMPWFMTVFGRDTIITCLQTLLFGTELARSALDTLAELQAREDDASVDAEPGKIVHEVRHGRAAKHWHGAYYGTVDATPLYLILLSEVWRWTGDDRLVHGLKDNAMAALRWIDEYGDRDGDGFVEYERRTPHGLVNQSWKDSEDSQRFSDGRLAEPPIAPCEVQGYVYDAKVRCAELAREVWRDRVLAERLEAEAATLDIAFNDRFWIDARGGYYALALDRNKEPVDSLCSNIGHLLWSGIVPPGRVECIVDALLGEELWSGWGVRTMSAGDAGYNPLSYHNGTVWPHDNSLIAWGLTRCGYWAEAQKIAHRMLEASEHFDSQLPEVFAGLSRAETPFPIAYPTAARPQAWAAGTPVLLLQLLLGLSPNHRRHVLETVAPVELPDWTGSIRLSKIRAFDREWEARVERGRISVERT